MIYLGTLGRMIGIKCPSSQNLEHQERYTFQTTLEGRRKAQVRPRGPRTWSLQTSDATTQGQAATLMQFAQGAWGPGPFWFISADARVTNMLTPEQANCDPIAGTSVADGGRFAGPMKTLEGWAARSLGNANPSKLLYFGGEYIPVFENTPITASAHVLGAGASVRVYFYDANLAIIGSATSTVIAQSGTPVRSWVTAIPPIGSASCRIFAINAVQACMPSITLTDRLLPWTDGQGCPKAVVSQVSRSQTIATERATYTNVSFQVTEVG